MLQLGLQLGSAIDGEGHKMAIDKGLYDILAASIKDKGQLAEAVKAAEAREATIRAETVKTATSPHIHNAIVTMDGADLLVRINTKGEAVRAVSAKGDLWERIACNVGGNSMPVRVNDKPFQLVGGLYRKCTAAELTAFKAEQAGVTK